MEHTVEDRVLELLRGLDPMTADRVLDTCRKKLREERYFRRLELPQTWQPVLRPGFSQYVVSDMGYVRLASKRDTQVLRPSFSHDYARAPMSAPGRKGAAQEMIHELVYESFVLFQPLPKQPSKSRDEVVNHINGDKYDPCISNLELTDQGKNLLHAYRIGLRSARPSYGT